jgi:hypothetical protein
MHGATVKIKKKILTLFSFSLLHFMIFSWPLSMYDFLLLCSYTHSLKMARQVENVLTKRYEVT